jgi:hypothetical protein
MVRGLAEERFQRSRLDVQEMAARKPKPQSQSIRSVFKAIGPVLPDPRWDILARVSDRDQRCEQ